MRCDEPHLERSMAALSLCDTGRDRVLSGVRFLRVALGISVFATMRQRRHRSSLRKMLALIQRLWPFSSTEQASLGNAHAVLEAISERSDYGFRYVGVFGEPDVVDRGGQYTTDLHVVVPLYSENPDDPAPANLEYDLPDGLEDSNSEFFDILEAFGIDDLTELGDIQGKNIPLDFENGTLVPLWDELVEAPTRS